MPGAQFRELKASLHSKVLNEVDLENLNKMSETAAREQVSDLVRELLEREKTPLARAEREQLVRNSR